MHMGFFTCGSPKPWFSISKLCNDLDLDSLGCLHFRKPPYTMHTPFGNQLHKFRCTRPFRLGVSQWPAANWLNYWIHLPNYQMYTNHYGSIWGFPKKIPKSLWVSILCITMVRRLPWLSPIPGGHAAWRSCCLGFPPRYHSGLCRGRRRGSCAAAAVPSIRSDFSEVSAACDGKSSGSRGKSKGGGECHVRKARDFSPKQCDHTERFLR